MVTEAIVTCVSASAAITYPHQVSSSKPEKSIRSYALVVVIERAPFYANARDQSQVLRALARRIFYKRRGVEAVRAVQVGKKPQPLARVERDALRREKFRARKGGVFLVLALEGGHHRVVFLTQDAAGGVDQASAGLEQ